jgi:hypothetical protein
MRDESSSIQAEMFGETFDLPTGQLHPITKLQNSRNSSLVPESELTV